MTEQPLPDYRHPPVDEIVATVQFSPMLSFGIREMFALANALEDWQLLDTRPALEPIIEDPPGASTNRLGFGFGTPPQRAVFTRGDNWQLQIQNDRIALGELRSAERPSSTHVLPQLRELLKCVALALPSADSSRGTSAPEIVELIYVNRLDAARGFNGWGRLGELLVGVGPQPGRSLANPEGMQLAWAFTLLDEDAFVGRLRAEVSPAGDGAAQLQLNSRRYVEDMDPIAVLESCHHDIVRGFDDLTTEAAHQTWGKYR